MQQGNENNIMAILNGFFLNAFGVLKIPSRRFMMCYAGVSMETRCLRSGVTQLSNFQR